MGVSWAHQKKKKKLVILKCRLLLLYATTNHFSIGLWHITCDETWILYDNWWWLAQWLDQEEAPKLFPKPRLHQKKGHGHCWRSASGLIHCSFLNPGKMIICEKYAQQISEMHWTLICPQPALINRKGLILLHDNAQPHVTQPVLQKLNELDYEVLPHPSYSPDLSPTNYHFFKHLNNHFVGRMLPQPAGCRKCFPRVHSILKHRFLCYRNKQTYFSLAKLCWL